MAGVYHFESEVVNGGTDETIKRVTGAWMRDRYQPRGLEQCPLFKKFGSWEELAKHTRTTGVGVGVLIYRKDGYFCLEAGHREGELLTLPVIAAGPLRINAVIRTGGTARIELTDAAGRPLSAYAAANAAVLGPGDYPDREVIFGSGKPLPQGKFRIRMKLRDGKLFTLGFGDRKDW
jgi:hypothetical protein